MENNKSTFTEITVNGYVGVADLSPVGTFVFCVLCFCFWASDLNLLGEGGTMAVGFLGLAVFVPYMITGISLAKKGLVLGGNTYILFGAVFGSSGGLFNTFSGVFAKYGIPFNYKVIGIAFLLAGLYLLLLLPGVARIDKVNFFIFFFGAVGVLGSAFTIFGVLPEKFNVFNGWALFMDGVVGFYAVIATILNSLGYHLPFGKPFAS